MTKSFKLFRIVCTITDKALEYGSDLPHDHRTYGNGTGQWYDRGQWSQVGSFWRTEEGVKKHLHNLCHDWQRKWAPAKYPRYTNDRDTWLEPIPGAVDWSRLRHLRVEQILVTDYSKREFSAHDFMGIPETVAA